MTPKLAKDFEVPAGILSIVIFACVLGSIAFTVLIIIQQANEERRRQEALARANKARRLKSVETNKDIVPPKAPEIDGKKGYHLFLSHVWGTGQDQMRIVKQRLLEMMPDLSVFLDVDDLEDISDLEGYVDRSVHILIFCSKGYFTSKNCMREIRSCTQKGKPMIAVLDPDSATGAMSIDEIKTELLQKIRRFAETQT